MVIFHSYGTVNQMVDHLNYHFFKLGSPHVLTMTHQYFNNDFCFCRSQAEDSNILEL